MEGIKVKGTMEGIKVKGTLLVDVTEETTSVASSARCAVPRPLHVRVVTMLHVTGSHARMQSLTVKKDDSCNTE